MRKSEDPTLRQLKVPMALLIDGGEDLAGQLSQAAFTAQVLVTECTAHDAPTIAAELRPLILALSQPVYEHDRESYDALARDIRATLLVLPPKGMPAARMLRTLQERMTEAESQRPSWPT